MLRVTCLKALAVQSGFCIPVSAAECWRVWQVIKLPANKYTVREKEMLSNVVPVEFFEVAKSPWLSSVLGIGLLGALGYIW